MSQSKQGEPGILSRLWPPFLFVLGCLLVAGIYYFFYVDKKSSYLMSRDFRYLATIGKQTREAVDRQGKIFSNLALKPDIVSPAVAADPQREKQRARYLRDLVPLFENVLPKSTQEWGRGKLLHRIEATPDGPRLAFFYAPPKAKSSESEPFVLTGGISFEKLLGTYFQSRGAFESILLANHEGDVVYQQGTQDLSIAQLDELAETRRGKTRESDTGGGREGKKTAETRAAALFVSSDYFDVELSGREYRVFVEPVDLPLNTFAGSDELPGAAVTGETHPWLICGLVSRKAFVYKSMAVSSALILSCIGVLLLGALSWPFVKLRLIGESQRVGVFDVLLLGLCSLLVVSVLTLFLLDLFAFGSLKALAAQQAESLAERMEENVRTEIRAAFEQLGELAGRSPAGEVGEDRSELGDVLEDRDLDVHSYPFLDIFSMLDDQGKQQRKWTLDTSAAARFPVAARPYFRNARDGETWSFPDPRPPATKVGPFFLEPIVGWGNGVRAAVLARPTGQPAYPVATLSIPMLSLIEPVLPPGFSFAVVDGAGLVLFHSDSRRNGTENLFVETDQDRHLRSAVFARRTETMHLRYWGEDYIARTSPIEGLPWTIVALRDLRTLRSVNIEWIASTLVFLLIYLGTLAGLLTLVAGSRPAYRAGWAWPVPERACAYLDLAILFLLLAGAFALSIFGLRGGEWLLAISWMLPFLALVAAYLKLETHGSGPKRIAAEVCAVLLATGLVASLVAAPLESGASRWAGPGPASALLVAVVCVAALRRPGEATAEGGWRRFRQQVPISRTYPLAAALLLLLAAALPTAGLFKVAHRIQLESFVKHGQLRLAAGLKERAMNARRSFSESKGACKSYLLDDRLAVRNTAGARAGSLAGLDVYASAFFDTRVGLPPLRPDPVLDCEEKPVARVAVRGDLPPAGCTDPGKGFFFEDLLPYASELSAELHELLHEGSSDRQWRWRECGNDRLSLASSDYPGGGGARQLRLESSIPRSGWRAALIPVAEAEESGTFAAGAVPSLAVVLRLLGGGLFLCLVGGLVLFISRRIFLVDLREPLWSGPQGTSPAPVGRNVFWVGRHPLPGDPAQVFARVDLSAVGDELEAWAAQRDGLVASGKPILVEHFETGLADRAASARKLDRLEDLVEIEDRTVVVLSRVSPTRLFARDERTSRRNGAGAEAALLEERWRALLDAFTIVEEDLRVGAGRPENRSALRGLWTWLLLTRPIQNDTLREEGTGDELLQKIAKDLDGQVEGMSREQILEEFCDRAEKHYRALWASCSPDEKVVLEHLAEEGLVNAKNRRTVRRLMARGLIRRSPNLRLMNETFRRFVVSSICRNQVLKIESKAEPSAWDRFRWPFFAVLSASILFFFATQQEALESTLATIAGATAGLPALVKILDLFGGKRGGARSELSK